ncbi:MAG: DEAD/DEAH box helicase family protein [Lachnospiraceae bacterium]|nr:DEAD/DEAH box helicase family protein [Lachnospiraceae bacterium]
MKDEIKEKITYSNLIKNTVSRVTNDEKEYERFLRFWSRGNMTSFDIVSLLHIYEENPNVYVMLSYNEWKKAGYQVLAGKKAIRVGNLEFFNYNESETKKSSMRYVFSIDDTIKKTKDYTILFPDTHEFKEIAGVNNENYNRSFGFELKLLDSYITEYNIFASENDEFIKDTCRFILESRYAGATGSYNFSKCKELYNEPVKLYNTLNRVKEIVGNFIEKFTEMNISNKIESTRDEYSDINENDIFANYHIELHEHLKKILNSELTDDVKKTFLQRVIKRVNTECKINGLKCNIFYENGDIFCRIKSNYGEFTKKVDMDKLLDRSISIINSGIKEVKINDNEQPIANSFINVYDEFFSYAVIARLVANGNQNFLYFVNNGSDFEKYPDELKNILVKEKNGYVCEKSEFEDIAEELNLKFIADNKTLNLTAIKFALNDIGRVEGKITKYDIGIEPSKKDEKGDMEEATKEEAQPEDNFPQPDPTAEPIVTIIWSEHSRFYDGETMSLSEANTLMGSLDEATSKEDGYYKTKFRIDFVMDGQSDNYTGRQDLGDGDGTLIDHIEKYHAYYENTDKAERSMLLNEFVLYLKLHDSLSKMEQTATKALQENESMTTTETAYYTAMKEYVSNCRAMVNQGDYSLPPAPQLKDFDTELEAYREHVKEEIAQEAAASGMTVEEYATNGYEPYAVEMPDLSISVSDIEDTTIKHKFSYSNDWSLSKSLKEKFYDNINAIITLKNVEKSERNATLEEQETLSKYIGWGGLSEAFDNTKDNWKNEYNKLLEILNDEEYEAAKKSVNTSFYTNKEIINAIYSGLSDMGFTGGNILEPAMGVGNFFSAMPLAVREKSKLFGVEIDDISGRIAKILHPDADISICGFEDTDFSNNTFDCIIGNVPFGDFGVYDKKYNKHNLLIHDYFIAKSLDIVRPGGIVAFITSTGTLDKKSEKFRKYIAERAELLGAVRLPNNAFKDVNTVATSDIIFLKKREKLVSIEPMWVHTGLINQEDDISINMYYHENYNNLLGTLKKDNRFGTDGIVYLEADKNRDYKEEVKKAIASMDFKGQYTDAEGSYPFDNDETDIKTLIPADPKVKNHTYTVIDDNVYYRNDSVMQLYDKGGKSEKRIRGLIEIKSVMKTLINEMINNCDDNVLTDLQEQLSNKYDSFVKANGYINLTANEQAFKEDVEYPLLCSLENKKDEIYIKSDIFTKRTIKTAAEKTECESSFEALNVCIGKYAKVDMNYISSLLPNKKIKQIISDLRGEIFKNPLSADEDINVGWESKEEYLSGNVREKLEIARLYNKENKFDDNILALQKVVPVDISAGEITCNIGCHWIDKEDYEKFINELFDIKSVWDKCKINKYTLDNLYSIDNKVYFARRYSTLSSVTYGTRRMSAVEIYEDLLNNKIIEVRDRVEDENGNVKYVRNAQESQFAQEKAEMINDKFKNWLFQDAERREYYVTKYNKMFNSEVVRKFDGSNIELQNHSVDIELRSHQKDAIARIIRGGNTLLAHCVGAGKTYCMIAGCMELKRLGFANKPLMVVPSHLTKQTADEFLKLYPSANILLTTTKDFQKHNRKVFVSKIATGDYDAVIIGHSQFDLIPISKARQEHMINKEIEEVKSYLDTLNKDERLTVKQLNSKLKKLELKLKKLSDSTKDDTITFEELGVDALFVDEAHEYKNLSFNTRLGSKVAGINANGSERAYDMYMKVEYIQEKTPGRNVVFATGTPISNSLAEMYTMQKYLGKQQLEKKGLMCFDAWASMFGKIETSWEVAPEGGGNKYRAKTRFARFNNVAELNRMYRAFADVRMADSINLDVPKLKNGDYTIVETELTDVQAEYMQLLMERAEMIHIGNVDPADDNMLKICNEARLVAADPRLILNNENLDADYFGYTKLDAVVDKVYEKYIEYNDLKATQAIMSDIGTPGKKDFDIYNYIKLKLIEKGIPEKEIMFIHDANDDKKKADLFDSLRKGDVRIIIGSTSKMGTGTNIQDRLCAMHEIDVPWRPSDVEQREGRIIRQGNMFDEVEIFRYITKGTFDSYNWNVIEKKQRYISQIMTSDINVRECDDIDEVTMSYAQMKAVCSGNPDIQREIEVEADIIRLKALKSSWQNERYTVENKIDRILPKKIQEYTEIINNYNDDIKKYSHYNSSNTDSDGNVPYVININKNIFTNKDEAGKEILRESYKAELNIRKSIGFYKDFELKLLNTNDIFGFKREIIICGKNNYHIDITNATSTGISIMLENKLKKLSDNKADVENKLEHTNQDLEKAKISRDIPFAHEEELKSLLIEKEEIRKRLYPDSGELSEDNNLELNNVKARAAQI